MRLWQERHYPLALALVAGVLWQLFDVRFPTSTETLLASALTLGSILAGFLATAKTILISLAGSSTMASLRRTGFLNYVIEYVASGIWSAFGFSVLSLSGFFFSPPPDWYATVWIVGGVYAGATFVRVTRILLKVLRNIQREQEVSQ